MKHHCDTKDCIYFGQPTSANMCECHQSETQMLSAELKKAEERATYWQLIAERKPAYAHMCRDGHVQIGHNDSEHEQCPLCRAQATLIAIMDKAEGRDLSGDDAEHMAWTAKAALSTIA